MPAMRHPPSPPGYPLLGHLPMQLGNPLTNLTRVTREYGDITRLRFGPITSYLINDPALIERVLVTDNKLYSKDRFMVDLRQVLGLGLLTSDGDFWRRQRRLAQPAFHRQRIAGYAGAMVAASEAAASSWWPGQVRDIHDEMMRLSLDVLGRTLFPAQTRGLAEEIGVSLEAVMERYSSMIRMALPWFERLPVPAARRFRRAVQTLDTLVRRLIQEHRARGEYGDDLLSMLLAARDEDGSAMDETQLRDEVITLFLAGHETTALTLSWAFYLLSQNPEADRRLFAELSEVLGDRPATLEDAPKLRYTEQVISETMRLYPPAWSLGREAITDTELGGYTIPKGSQIWASQWIMHRDPRYFSEPERFLPERWEGDLAKKLPRFAYFPFGGGPRLCIGNNFALLSAQLMLATLARRFRVAVLPGHRVVPQPSITLRPLGGLRAELHARAPRPTSSASSRPDWSAPLRP